MSSIYEQIQYLRRLCVHECGVIDSMCREVINKQNVPLEEVQRILDWYKERKTKALAWFEYEEACLLNRIPGLPRGEDGAPPCDEYERLMRQAAANASPLHEGGNEFAEILSLIWMMCSISVSAALARSVADLRPIEQKIVTELHRLSKKSSEELDHASGGEVVTKAAGMKPKLKPRSTQ